MESFGVGGGVVKSNMNRGFSLTIALERYCMDIKNKK